MKIYHLKKRTPLHISTFPTNSIHSHSPHSLPTNIKLPKPNSLNHSPKKHTQQTRACLHSPSPNTLYRIGCYYL